MLLLLLFWGLSFLALTVVGVATYSLFDKEMKDGRLTDFFFMGLVVSATLSSFASIIVPINSAFQIGFFTTVGLVGLIRRQALKNGWKRVKEDVQQYNSVHKLLLIFVVVFTAMVGAKEIWVSDTWLYHAQNIKWIKNYPVLPGLAYLQPQLGYNSLFFPLAALFSVDFTTFSSAINATIFPLNGVVLLVLLGQLLHYFFRYLKRAVCWKSVFYLLVFGASFLLLLRSASSANPDLVCAVITIYCVLFFLEKKADDSTRSLLLMTGLISVCVGFKLSTILLGLLLLPLLYQNFSIDKLLLVSSLGLFLMAPFFIRNYYLSGYLIFPFPSIDIFQPDWKVPLKVVADEKVVIENWGRGLRHITKTPFSEWFPAWWQRKDLFETPILLANLAILFTLFVFIKNKQWTIVGLQIFVLLSGLFWFLNAPDVRFAYGVLFVGAGFSIASFFLFPFLRKQMNPKRLLFGLVLAILVSVNFHKLHIKDVVTNPFKWVLPMGFNLSETEKIITNLTLYRPTNRGTCANHPLPCSSRILKISPNSQLFLRNGVDFSDGFIVKEIEN
ncbi:MAG: hypothetical protein AAF960_07865 [Bacteroidota bacterium]